MQVIYNGSISSGSFVIDQDENDRHAPNDGAESAATFSDSEDIYTVQCFPLYSLLLAVGRTHVDYFGLDVEGSEHKILKTIPWHKVYMQVRTSTSLSFSLIMVHENLTISRYALLFYRH